MCTPSLYILPTDTGLVADRLWPRFDPEDLEPDTLPADRIDGGLGGLGGGAPLCEREDTRLFVGFATMPTFARFSLGTLLIVALSSATMTYYLVSCLKSEMEIGNRK